MKRLFKIALGVLGALSVAGAPAEPDQEVCRTVVFLPPEASLTAEGLTRVRVPGCEPDPVTGLPVLPVQGLTLELPSDAEVLALTLVPDAVQEIPLEAPVEWGRPPVAPGEPPAGAIAPDPAVYGGTAPYPDLAKPRWRADPTASATRLSVQVPPVLYVPSRQALLAAGSVTVRVAFRIKAAAARKSGLKPTPLEPGTHTYAVISTSNLISNTPGPWNLQTLCDARARAGFTPVLVSTEWINANYEGTNQAIRTRAFVQDAYQIWGLRYLLLAGTFDLLPVQKLYISFKDFFYDRTATIPADALYFGCMDGSFDNNGNGRYGEPTDGLNGGDIDLTAEVLVGRFPVSNTVELANMVRKTLRYESATAQELRPQAFAAEKVNLGSLVYADGYMEELRYGANNNGLSSVGFKSSSYSNVLDADIILYDSTNYLWTTGDALTYLNKNLATVNHMGHGSTKQCVKISLYLPSNQSAIAAFTNEVPYFMYSQACNAGEFDTPDCFAEQIVTVSNAAFAAVMNAREGWEYPDVVGGFSHRYHRAFWDAALRGAATRLGEINEQSRRMHLYLISPTSQNYWRWVFFELNLFGDPATPFVPAANLAPPAISHTPLSNTYDTQSLYRVTCTVEPIGIYDPDSPSLTWRTDRDPGASQTQRMARVSGNLFEAFIAPQPANTRIAYTLSARNHAGIEAASPASGEHAFYVTDRLTFTVKGSPADFGSPSPDYGSHAYASGLVASASAPALVTLGDDIRVTNFGFVGTGSAPQSGTNQSVSFRMDADSMLVWLWFREHRLQLLSDAGSAPAQTFWVAQNAAFPVPEAAGTLSLSNGTLCAFAEWRLDGSRSPAAPGLSAPSYGDLVMDAPHILTAHYLPADLDADTNSIPDWWECRYFGQNGQDPAADADGDGFTLAQEFADRCNPLSAASVPAAPEIAFAPLAETQTRPGPFTVRATLTDTYQIAQAAVYWHRRTEAWQSTPLLVVSNNVFEAQIGAASAPGDDFEYQIVAADPSGRTSQTEVFYFFLSYPVADTSRFHDLAFVALPTQSTVGAYMNLHNTGNADLVWTVQVARVETITDPALPCWSRTSLGQPWSPSTNRSASAPYSLYSTLQSSDQVNGPAVRSSISMFPFVVGPKAALSFNYWIHSETYQSTTRAFDGGIVEYSLDNGSTFTQLRGPYTHTIYGWTYSPWTNGTPCLAGNGTEGWRTATFDFAKEYPEENGFQGRTLLLRFHYGGDNNTDYEGWYIDNVTVAPIQWPQGFVNSIEGTYGYTIPAGGNKRIYWSNLPTCMDLRDSHMTVFLLSNDPVAPAYSFFWQVKIRDYPLLPVLGAAQSSAGDGRVALTAAVADRDGEPVSLTFDWSADGGQTWRPAALTNLAAAVGATPSNAPAGAVANLATATNGVPLTNRLAAVWASRAVAPPLTMNTQMLFRVLATNGYYGKTYLSPLFAVDNEPPLFSPGALSVAPLSAVGPYAVTTNLLTLSWPTATDNPSPVLTYRLLDTPTNLVPAVATTSLTSLVTATLALSNALDLAHRFEVVAIDPAGNASAPLDAALLVLNPASDFDADGLSNADEETAGTLATDSASRFVAALQPAPDAPGTLSLTWDGAPNRLYAVEATTTLFPPDWQPLPGATSILGTGAPIRVELPSGPSSSFFRIRVYLTP